MQQQYNMWGAHGAKMSTCCTPHSPPSSCSPKEAKLWSANAHCCQCYHLFIIIHPCDMSKHFLICSMLCWVSARALAMIYADLVLLGFSIIHILRKISHDPYQTICFILLVVIYLFGTSAIRSEPVSCRCVSALFVLNCLFGNLTIQKHYFMTPRWGVSVCICLVCICLNIPCSAWN